MHKTGRVAGPYARQIVNSRLKFWFCSLDIYHDARRYELRFQSSSHIGSLRYRPYFYDGRVPPRASNFEAYRVPRNILEFPTADFDSRLPDAGTAGSFYAAALSLLTPGDIADITMMRLTGSPPSRFREETCPAPSPRLL